MLGRDDCRSKDRDAMIGAGGRGYRYIDELIACTAILLSCLDRARLCRVQLAACSLQWFKVDEMKLLMGCFFRNSESSNRVGTDVPRSGARQGKPHII
jgi:hypothetical protein